LIRSGLPEILGIGMDSGFELAPDSVSIRTRRTGQSVEQFDESLRMMFGDLTHFVGAWSDRLAIIVITKMAGGDGGGQGLRHGQTRRHPAWFGAMMLSQGRMA
jgi:hypothetical protein